jgi:hypothetical protein
MAIVGSRCNPRFASVHRFGMAAAVPVLGGLLAAGCVSGGVRVTGDPTQGNTQTFEQSETAVNVSNFSGQQVITATYNDGTDSGATIQYTSGTRKVLQGASLLGWSYSTDGGTSWHYGGKVAPPKGWAAIWGDPAITRSHLDQRYVFISNLAMPSSLFPPGGVDGPVNDYIGGACIYRSTNGGVSFAFLQCVDNDHHFYDGGSMAAGTDGSIYAGYVDVDTDRIDVWRSPGVNGPFTRMSSPFGSTPMVTHPRLRFDAISGSLYVAAQQWDGTVLVTRFHNGAWATPQAASYPAAIYPIFQLSDRKLRTGPQFSFDVGAESVHGNDALRFVYTRWDPDGHRYYVRGSICTRDLSSPCQDAPEWGTTPGNLNLTGDQFDPVVRAFPGFLTIPPAWKVTYLTRQNHPNGNQVAVYQGNLAVLPNGTRVLLPFKLIDDQTVCGDARGYWGDYDDLQLQGFTDSLAAIFLRTFTDSRQGCPTQWTYTSKHQHVSSALIH